MSLEHTLPNYGDSFIRTAQLRSAKRLPTGDITTTPSASIRFCLFLIYYFCLCDTILKWFPSGIAIALRYLPEVALYVFAFSLLTKKWRIVSFPLFWPLCGCALTMAISGFLNSSSLLATAGDFRSFFRFTAFTYIGWRTAITPRRAAEYISGFLRLTVVELVIGGIELVGGDGTRSFFAPALGWSDGAPAVSPYLTAHLENLGGGSWLSGTMADYNQFGMFMTMSCVLALALYFMKGSRRHLWLAFASALAVVLSFSRHSLLLLALALGCTFLLRRKRIASPYLIRGVIVAVLLGVAFIGLNKQVGAAFEERLASIVSPEVLGGDQAANIRLYIAVQLTPRFLSAYPFFGQGPIAPTDKVTYGEMDTSQGPPLKAAPDLRGEITFFFGDVVWVMVLGLYGCFGLAAFGYVFWSIATAAKRVRKGNPNSVGVVLAEGCLVMIVVCVASGFFSLEIVARDTIPVFWLLAGMVLSLATNSRPATQVLAI